MTLNAPSQHRDRTAAAPLSDGKRSALSLIILLHLFCVAAGLLTNTAQSPLAQELRRVLGPYTLTLDLDPQFPAGWPLTHAMENDDDHQWIVETPTGEPLGTWPTIPPTFVDRLNSRAAHWQQFVRRTSMYLAEENDDGIAELARSISTQQFAGRDLDRLVVKCRRYDPPTWMEDGDAAPSANRFVDVYVADVMRDARGTVRVLKRVATAEAAQLRGGGAPGHSPAKPSSSVPAGE